MNTDDLDEFWDYILEEDRENYEQRKKENEDQPISMYSLGLFESDFF